MANDEKWKPEIGEVVQLRTGTEAIKAFLRAQSFGGPRDRAYVGQAHTFLGARGARRLGDVTLRDVGDAIVEEIQRAAETYFADELRAAVDRIDVDALAQNILRRIDRDATTRTTRSEETSDGE